ncbi:PepSY domain-containing protein [Dyella ginsengisoli]|uniref:PepSY domain-containing protein n=1 Tax=Dyella ginsengisoli TaxID=363848 RepID=UPI0004777C43|nr:PepSY domain-containing protein [Dyella ginsengisoli]
MRKATVLIVSLVLSGGVFAASAPRAVPKIDMASARTIALHVVPGKIVKEELEKEHGGSGLRYSFDILAKGITHEVGVDAFDGKVLENSIDDGKD